jgi:hypothetical protein
VAEKPRPVVTWVFGMKARECRGDGPLGLFADLPSIPPTIPASATTSPAPTGVVSLVDLSLTSSNSVPLDPPPRCG